MAARGLVIEETGEGDDGSDIDSRSGPEDQGACTVHRELAHGANDKIDNPRHQNVVCQTGVDARGDPGSRCTAGGRARRGTGPVLRAYVDPAATIERFGERAVAVWPQIKVSYYRHWQLALAFGSANSGVA